MRILLFVVLPLLIIGGVAYHYRSSWLPKLTNIGQPSREVSVVALPAPPTTSPVPTVEPTSIYVGTAEPAQPAVVGQMPSTGPETGWGLGLLVLSAAGTGGFLYLLSARAKLARAISETHVL